MWLLKLVIGYISKCLCCAPKYVTHVKWGGGTHLKPKWWPWVTMKMSPPHMTSLERAWFPGGLHWFSWGGYILIPHCNWFLNLCQKKKKRSLQRKTNVGVSTITCNTWAAHLVWNMIIFVGVGCSCASKYVTIEKGISSKIKKNRWLKLCHIWGCWLLFYSIVCHSKHKNCLAKIAW